MKREYKILKVELAKIISHSVIVSKNRGMEICGLLIDNGYFVELLEVKNKTKRGGGFSFLYEEIKTIQKISKMFKHEIIGTFHSHPSYIAEPSESDVKGALNDSLMIVIDVMGRNALLWHIKDRKKVKLKLKLI